MSSGNANAELANNGWAAVPRSHSQALESINKNEHAKLDLDSVKVPDTGVARKVFEYAKNTLPERTFNHSMRVWNYGNAIIQTHFPHLTPLVETYFLTCLFHDIGTTSDYMKGTHLSFEYWGAIKARMFLGEHGAPSDQADAVCEAIIRHAELGETGMITSLGLLIQLTTSFDNVGANPHLIDTSTIEAVVAKYPRKGWSSCFAACMTKEMELKPWCRTTAQEGFVESIVGNELMEPYDK
ncbi:cyanamide hydratase [Macroventuria anomochaeta]|uniref:Cyanamide hydratase n=1 Tax=Macroventuria anomochaeta TaxID=301207 RepID=A0ACB6SAC7_9PLEO|nr:cyanamide hydratase [Macroventuria anomochaeta]KAF2630932.1 cyanamide hydratase [Macroventuria anomochaeta]